MASVNDGVAEEMLSPSIWSNLPEELVERVLERVPFWTLIRFRAVCRQWNSLIMSPAFNRGYQKRGSPKCVPVLVPVDLVESAKWAINPYDSETGSWLSVSLSFLQPASHSGSLYLTASSGGLMCFESDDRRNFIVCNPVTRRWRHLELPSVPGRTVSPRQGTYYRHTVTGHTVTGLVVDQETGNYILVVASLGSGYERRTLLYDSAARAWRSGKDVPAGKRFLHPGALTCNGKLYCLVENPRGLEERSCTWRLVKYEPVNDNWSEVPVEIGWPGWNSTELELVEHGRQVLLVARGLNRRWLPNNTFYSVWYNTFYKVSESSAGSEMTLVQDRSRFQALDKSIGSSTKLENVMKCPGCFAGQGDLIYTTGNPFFTNDEVQVLRVLVLNSANQNCAFLPSWRREELKAKMQMEIKMLEPSLTAAV